MRKIISMMHISLDGFVADLDAPPPGLDWITYDKDLEGYARSMLPDVDVAIHGRPSYRMMEAYWPTVLDEENPDAATLEHAQWLQQSLKIVVSRTLKPEDITWENSMLISGDLTEAFTALKQQPGKNMMIFGSPGLVKSLAALDLIDEYRINVNPTILGGGMPMFGSTGVRLPLTLAGSRTLDSGVVLLHYIRERE
jgi:dihydrofolate reductase